MNNIRHKYPYLNLLVTINSRIVGNINTSNLRFTDETDLGHLNNIVKSIFHSLIVQNKNEALLTLLNSSGHLLYYQAFFDGNSRTIKIFIKLILNKLKFNFKYELDAHLIPMLFDGENCTNEDIIKFKKNVNLSIK